MVNVCQRRRIERMQYIFPVPSSLSPVQQPLAPGAGAETKLEPT